MKPAFVMTLLAGLASVPAASQAQAGAVQVQTPPPVPTRVSDLHFVSAPRAEQVMQAYPIRALRRGVSAELAFPCEVDGAGRLSCTAARGRQSDGGTELLPEFERAGQRLLPLYRVAPELKNGGPSAGAHILLGMRFQVQD